MVATGWDEGEAHLTGRFRARYKLTDYGIFTVTMRNIFMDVLAMGDKDRKQSDCEPIANIIGKVLQTCQGGEGQNARAVWDLWDRVVGEALARNAQPAAFKQRILLVHVSSSVWMQELHFLKKELITRLNQAAGDRVVEDIQFKIGSFSTE